MNSFLDKLLLNNKSYYTILICLIIAFCFALLYQHKPQQKTIIQPFKVLEVSVSHNYIVSPKHYNCLDDQDCSLLAEAIYYEARGEDLEGQIAVGWVIMNRVESKYFPNSIKEVIYKKHQFSYTTDGSMKNGFYNSEAYKTAVKVAKGIILGVFDDPTNGADHYLNPDKLKRLPKWTKIYPKVASIGNHDFYERP